MASRRRFLPGYVRTTLACVSGVLASVVPFAVSGASSWNPTMLINTESFQEIDAGDGTTAVDLRFGSSTNTLKLLTTNVFQFSKSLSVQGGLSGSYLTIDHQANISGSLVVKGSATANGGFSGSTFYGSGLGDCSNATTQKLIYNPVTGRFGCGADQTGGGTGGGGAPEVGTASFSGAVHTLGDARYLQTSAAALRANNMTVSGAVVYSSGNTLQQNAKGLSGQVLISQGTSAPKWAAPVGGMIWYFDGIQSVTTRKGPVITMPFGVTLSGTTLSAKGAPTGSALIIDVNMNGTSIFSTRPQISAGQVAGNGAVFSVRTIPPNAVLTLDIDQVGSTFAGSGITIMLKGTRNY